LTARWLIGLAPGSSVDGVDAVLLEGAGAGLDLAVRLVQAVHQPYSRDMRSLLLRAASRTPVETRQLSLLHRLLGETFAAAARQVADRASFSLSNVVCAGCPGHGVWHEVEGRFPSLLELGMAAAVAERTGITTVSDFRTRDLAAGGQGVPIEALADFLLFRDPDEDRLLVHLGGLATVTRLPAGGRVADLTGFEAGPCNLLLDGLMRQLTNGREHFDAGGRNAVQGRCIEPALERWLAHPYWQRRPPRSLSPQAFCEEFVAQAVQMGRQMQCTMHDLLCTTTHLVVRGIVAALKRFLPNGPLVGRMLLSGGGARNGLLWHLLEQQLPGTALARTDNVGIPANLHKAMAYGVLAALTIDGVPANVPSVTGAAGARLLGSLTPGSATNWGRCLSWMASQSLVISH
jgi:anhydro-N-acetylmuramic acid kinase